MSGQWMRLPWSVSRHHVTDGRLACNSPVDVPAMVPADGGPWCRSCCMVLATPERNAARERARARVRADRAKPIAPKVAQPRHRAEPGTVFAGVDPLVETLHRYERGQL